MGAIAYISLHLKESGPDFEQQVLIRNEAKAFIARLTSYLDALGGGTKLGHLRIELDKDGTATRASATATITHANLSNGDTLVIGGVTLTKAAAPANESEFASGADATADAVSLVACINAHSKLKGIVVASNVAGVVTITYVQPGRVGNLITLTTNDATAFGLSGAVLSGGVSTQQTALRSYEYGQAG